MVEHHRNFYLMLSMKEKAIAFFSGNKIQGSDKYCIAYCFYII